MWSGPLLVLISWMLRQVVSKCPGTVLYLPSVKTSLKATYWFILRCSKTPNEQIRLIYQTLFVLNKFELELKALRWMSLFRQTFLTSKSCFALKKKMLMPELLKLCHEYKWQGYAFTYCF